MASIVSAGQVHSRSSSSSSSPPPEKKLKSSNDHQDESNTNTSSNGKGKSFKRNPDKASARRVKNNRKSRAQNMNKTGEDPIFFDALRFIGEEKLRQIVQEGQEWREVYTKGQQVEVEILGLGAHGEGIALNSESDWLITVPFVLPGEKVLVRVNENERLHSKGEIVRILSKKSESRRDDLVRCKYFGKCGGCQYQMTTYDSQLLFKQEVVRKAFSNFSDLPSNLLPSILPTLPSPSTYSYRTKLTPHFNLPKSIREIQKRSKSKNQSKVEDAEESLLNETNSHDLIIGFDTPKGVSLDGNKGNGGVLDIEECVIATKTINDSLQGERKRIKDTIHTFKNGSTLLMRDSLASFDHISTSKPEPTLNDLESQEKLISSLETITITDHKAPVKECVGSIKFESNAGSFFQNNRSILPSLISYVKDQIINNRDLESENQDRYLVDAYCGSGLFSLCLSSLFKEVSGVEISQDSIKWAKINAESNGITNTKFLAGNAEDIFGTIDYESDKTTVVIDPPRRGCDEVFINQLVKLGPKHIIYVSCNVHTQARDVGQLIRASPDYEILSIRGADLFPQTHHVEGVCVLRKRSEGDSRSELEGYKGNLSLAKSINQNK